MVRSFESDVLKEHPGGNDQSAADRMAWVSAEVSNLTCGTLSSGGEWVNSLWLRVPLGLKIKIPINKLLGKVI